jgi:aerobic carbon-monoxide dehydrogenase large subunit
MQCAARSARLDITLTELPTAVNPLGVKGAGQAGCMAQTIINAILDALAPLRRTRDNAARAVAF